MNLQSKLDVKKPVNVRVGNMIQQIKSDKEVIHVQHVSIFGFSI